MSTPGGLGFWRTVAVVLFYPVFALAFVLTWLGCLFDRLVPLPLPFPRHPDALAKRQAWCVAQLVKAGALPADAQVTRYEVRQFKKHEVFRSAVARVVIEYSHDGVARTFACIAKFAIQGGSLGTMVVSLFQKNAKNEVDFYNTYAHSGSDAPLRAYYARCSGGAGNFCLLLEEVRPTIEFSEEEGAPLAQARDVVKMYARFHARHWQAPQAKLPKVPVHIGAFSIDFMCSLAFGKKRRVLRHLARTSWHYCNRPQTIIHGDARVGNVLFRGQADGTPGEPLLIDWQSPHWAVGAYDLAYFLTLSLPSATRAAHEEELMRAYHAELVAHGVGGYDFAAFREDYSHCLVCVLGLLVVPLLGGEVTVNEANEARIISGGLMWSERLTATFDKFDADWIESRYGVDARAMQELISWTILHPPVLNRGACLVARELARRAQR